MVSAERSQHPDHSVYFPQLTEVPLPKVLDQRDTQSVIQFLDQLIKEEIYHPRSRGKYFGALVYGSLSTGQAHNGSDLDVCHIAIESNFDHIRPINHKLQTVFGLLYDGEGGIDPVRLLMPPLGLKEMRASSAEELDSIRKSLAFGLNQFSIPLIEDETIRREMEGMLGYTRIPLMPRRLPVNPYEREKPKARVENSRNLRVDLIREIQNDPEKYREYWDFRHYNLIFY